MAGKFEIKQSTNGKYHFNLLSRNGQVILSSQMYASRESAKNGIESVRKNAVEKDRFERRESKNGKPYFVLKAANGLEIGRSEMYSSRAAMENGISSVGKNAPLAKLVDSAAG